MFDEVRKTSSKSLIKFQGKITWQRPFVENYIDGFWNTIHERANIILQMSQGSGTPQHTANKRCLRTLLIKTQTPVQITDAVAIFCFKKYPRTQTVRKRCLRTQVKSEYKFFKIPDRLSGRNDVTSDDVNFRSGIRQN